VNLDVSPPQKCAGREPGFFPLACLLGFFLAVNLFTGTRYPTVWQDEGGYTDPAANANFGHGFTSSVFPGQPYGMFWAGNVPLHEFILTAWFHVFGFSLLSARAMSFFLISAAMVVLWISFRRSGLIHMNTFRFLAIVAMLCTTGLTMDYRSARPDCTTILLASLGFLAFTVSGKTRRRLILVFLGMFYPIAGLQLAAFAAFFAFVFLIFTRGKHFWDFLFLGFGIALGMGALAAFYAAHGVLHNFMLGVTQYSDLNGPHLPLFERVMRLPQILAIDKTQLGMVVVACVWLLWKRTGKFSVPTKRLGFAVVAWLFVTLAMVVTSKFPVYYAWMTIIPLTICLASYLEQVWLAQECRTYCRVALVVLAVIISTGLPLKLLVTALRWQSRDYAAMENYVRPSLADSQWFYADNVAYFAIKNSTNVVVLKPYLETITPEEKSRILVAVVDPRGVEDLQRLLGGNWKPIAQPLVSQWEATQVSSSTIRNIARRLIHNAQDADWQVCIFKRDI
jgi:hypothetical protein